VVYNKDQILAEADEAKKSVKPINTIKNQESAESIFNKFCKEKFKSSAIEICKNLSLESDVKVPCAVLQSWIAWSKKQNHAPATIRTRFFYIKDYMRNKNIKITNEDVADNIKLPRKLQKSMYPLTKEELRKIIDVASPKRKSLYLTHSSCGARIGELLQIRKKDINTDSERWVIHFREDITKTGVARSSFMSKEAMKYTKQLLDSKEDKDLVWATSPNTFNAEASEQCSLRIILKNLDLDMRYEKTMVRKITSHSMRAYFFTKAVRTHGENYAHTLTGHGNAYLLVYDRLTEKEKLAMYLKLEPEILVYESHDEDVAELREEIKKLKKESKQRDELWASFIQNTVQVPQAQKSEDEREGIKTPKVAEARKCPTCNQESHDKIGDHYKCLNPDCRIDSFQE